MRGKCNRFGLGDAPYFTDQSVDGLERLLMTDSLTVLQYELHFCAILLHDEPIRIKDFRACLDKLEQAWFQFADSEKQV